MNAPQTFTSHWHARTEADVLTELSTSHHGLTNEEVKSRQVSYGMNALPKGKKTTLLQIILHQLIHPLIFILLGAAAASVLIGEPGDAYFIFLVILINSALGAYQEFQAEKSANSLQQLIRIQARVTRNGKEKTINAEELVPGDLVWLESGAKVPADIRLIETHSLEIDESFLTGESLAAKKQTDAVLENKAVADQTNMAFAGATVMVGRGKGIVVATGGRTQVGQIAKHVSKGESAKPPLIVRMERFIRQITWFILALSIVLAVLLRWQGMDWAAIFFFIVALAVSAIPEGLPVALTVALSIATKRMAKRNVIVRKLTSVESLGSCTVIASDKTGTLTVNEQTATMIQLLDGTVWQVKGEGYNGDGLILKGGESEEPVLMKHHPALEQLIRISVLANEGVLEFEDGKWTHYGDAMDVALCALAYKSGIDPTTMRKNHPLKEQVPYESELKYAAAFYEVRGQNLVGAKGAVETILGFCSGLDNAATNKILQQADSWAAKGYRVLAFAEGAVSGTSIGDIQGLTFSGLIAFIDPLRSESKDSVITCKKAGIRVCMITGDHPATAGTIATELGIIEPGQSVVTGKMLTEAGEPTSSAFMQLVQSTNVFARVSPVQKLEIVDAMIRMGEFVAVTGDGVNDAPALKRANLGVAMGSGTDVAKEVGSMIITDDCFTSIVAGVEEGRHAYNNVRKVIYLLISTGAAEVVLFLLSIVVGLPLPLLAVQLLWLNLVTNGIQDVALAFEGGEPGAMQQPPRKPSESIFNERMIQQTIVSSLTIGIVVFSFWYYLIEVQEMKEYHARDLALLLMVFMQNFHVFNCRSEYTSAFKVPISRNYILIGGVLLAQGIHVASMHIPFMQNVLKIEPITLQEWMNVLLLAIPILLSMEVFKWFKNRKKKI